MAPRKRHTRTYVRLSSELNISGGISLIESSDKLDRLSFLFLFREHIGVSSHEDILHALIAICALASGWWS